VAIADLLVEAADDAPGVPATGCRFLMNLPSSLV
jgi:hypothetical protein